MIIIKQTYNNNNQYHNSKKRKYIISTRCIDQYSKQLHQKDPIYEFDQELEDNINLEDLAIIISRKVFEHRESIDDIDDVWKEMLCDIDIQYQNMQNTVVSTEGFYKVDEFRLSSFNFGVSRDETLGDYVRVGEDNNEKLKLEVYLLVRWETQHRPQETSQEFRQEGNFVFDETTGCVVPKDQAPGFIAKMKPGLLIIAECYRCDQKVVRQVKLFKNRTATFNLKQGIKCPKCRLHLSDLDSPCLTECEYNYQGEKADGQIINKMEWKTVQANHILYWKEDEQQIIDWIELKIFIRVFDTRYCTACQQQLEGDNEKDIEDNCFKGQCGHRYHTTCFKQVSKNGEGQCVAEGCNVKMAS